MSQLSGLVEAKGMQLIEQLIQDADVQAQGFAASTLTSFLQSRFAILYMQFGRNQNEADELSNMQGDSYAQAVCNGQGENFIVHISQSPYMDVIQNGVLPYTVGYGNEAMMPDGSTYASENRARAGSPIYELQKQGYDFESEVNGMIESLAVSEYNSIISSLTGQAS